MEEINEDDINYFYEKGYLTIKSLIPIETIDKIIEEVYINNPKNTKPGRLTDIWKEHDIIGKLAFNKKILDILEIIFKKKPIPFQTLNFYKGTEQKLHSDQIHFCSEPENLMCGVWIALEDITMEKGPLIYYPGSHKMEFMNMQKLNLKIGDYPSYEKKIEEIIEKSDFKPKYGLIKKGDVIIWHANLIHGGYKRIDDLTRMSMVIHYFFEGTKYWTPLNSSLNNRVYRNEKDFVNQKFRNIPSTQDLIKDNSDILKSDVDPVLQRVKIKNESLWVKYYKKKYNDLSNLSDIEAIKHYYTHGIHENREFYDQSFNWLSYAKDNKKLGIKDEKDAIIHFIRSKLGR